MLDLNIENSDRETVHARLLAQVRHLGLVNLKLSKAPPVYQATAGHNDLTTNTLTSRKRGKLGVRDANCDPR